MAKFVGDNLKPGDRQLLSKSMYFAAREMRRKNLFEQNKGKRINKKGDNARIAMRRADPTVDRNTTEYGKRKAGRNVNASGSRDYLHMRAEWAEPQFFKGKGLRRDKSLRFALSVQGTVRGYTDSSQYAIAWFRAAREACVGVPVLLLDTEAAA